MRRKELAGSIDDDSNTNREKRQRGGGQVGEDIQHLYREFQTKMSVSPSGAQCVQVGVKAFCPHMPSQCLCVLQGEAATSSAFDDFRVSPPLCDSSESAEFVGREGGGSPAGCSSARSQSALRVMGSSDNLAAEDSSPSQMSNSAHQLSMSCDDFDDELSFLANQVQLEQRSPGQPMPYIF